MAASWVKSLQCKSRAFEDVYHPTPKPLLSTASCRNSFQNLKDVIDNNTKPKPKPKSKSKPKPKPGPFLPSVSELQLGHPSRNVVEIIFHTRWGPKGFSGQVEMVFKIQNTPRSLSLFEDYRDSVRARAGPGPGGDSVRCTADGNEMMRFRSGVDFGGICSISGGKGSICTYSGGGAAHESAGGGRGRREMLVCRVIAGRVSNRVGLNGLLDGPGNLEFESVSGDNGELLLFDNRAVLPCFLVMYKL